MLYLARKAAGLVATSSAKPFGASVRFVGNVKPMPATFHALVGNGGVEKLHRVGGDVLQLDEFVTADVGMVHDFVDDDRADARAGVWIAGRGGELTGEMLVAGADDVASESAAIGRSAET